jgi:hypothetical protein
MVDCAVRPGRAFGCGPSGGRGGEGVGVGDLFSRYRIGHAFVVIAHGQGQAVVVLLSDKSHCGGEVLIRERQVRGNKWTYPV